MKNLILKPILLLLFVFVLFSCRNDGDSGNDPNSIVGTYQPTSIKFSGAYNGVPFVQEFVSNECQLKSRIVFKSDGNGSTNIWTDESGTCVQTNNETYTYTYNESTKALSITNSGSIQNGTVTTLNSTNLVYESQTTYDYNGQNVPATLTISANRIN